MKKRKATKKDIPRMMEMIRVNSPEYPKAIALKELEEMFSKTLYKPTYIVIEDKKEILGCGGFISSWADSMVVNMFWINVDPKFQGKGIGSEIVRELIGEIRKMKNPKPKMINIATNKPKFYEKFGFKKLGEKYDRNYILMGKLLSS
jgi:N-acetylglutamate synthase-like GNAT family acetyltransferase